MTAAGAPPVADDPDDGRTAAGVNQVSSSRMVRGGRVFSVSFGYCRAASACREGRR